MNRIQKGAYAVRMAVTFHEELAATGEPMLRSRILPSFEALAPLISSHQVAVYKPFVNEEVIRLVQQVHTPEYLEAVIGSGFYENALLSVASVLKGAELLCQQDYQGVFSYTGCAGHHAGQKRFWGFCYLNDVAVAIHRLRQIGLQRFLVLDIDPHFGDGTREFFQFDPDVIHINFHEGSRSVLDGQYHNYDYALNPGWDEEFIGVLQKSLRSEFEFEIMIVIFGHDSHYEDYGGFCLWDPTYNLIAKVIKDYVAGRPLLWVLSGGSNAAVARSVIPAIIQTLTED